MRFLRRLADPIRDKLSPGARGLDFGCGPQPVLAEFLSSGGFPTVSYDPLFYPDTSVLEPSYDFVTCSEVLEHVHDPRSVLQQFARLLRNGGILGVMTRFHGVEAPFATWWYRRDPTHVCFYSEATMQWIADSLAWTVAFPAPHVALFSIAVPHASGLADQGSPPRMSWTDSWEWTRAQPDIVLETRNER